MNEKEFLESLFKTYSSRCDISPYSRMMREFLVRKSSPFLSGGRALELGCEVGYMTELLAPFFERIDVVDGSKSFLREAKKRGIKNAFFYECLFEEFIGHGEYDAVFASHVLEHVKEPGAFLKMVKGCLTPSGKLFLAVPNAFCASRQLAVKMGLFESVFSLTENDVRGGHRRVYSPELLKEEILSAGFEILDLSGVFFKPFADFQLDELIEKSFLREEHLEGLFSLGEVYPELCGDVFCVCTI